MGGGHLVEEEEKELLGGFSWAEFFSNSVESQPSQHQINFDKDLIWGFIPTLVSGGPWWVPIELICLSLCLYGSLSIFLCLSIRSSTSIFGDHSCGL